MANLKSHTGMFFEVVLRMQETQENGTVKMVKKTIVVDASSFGEAEKKAVEEMSCYTGDVEVVNINPAPYKEVFSSDDEKDDRFYKCKLSFVIEDDRTGKLKKTKVVYLVQAASINKAQSYIDNEIMNGVMADYETCCVSETPIFVCFFHAADEK